MPDRFACSPLLRVPWQVIGNGATLLRMIEIDGNLTAGTLHTRQRKGVLSILRCEISMIRIILNKYLPLS